MSKKNKSKASKRLVRLRQNLPPEERDDLSLALEAICAPVLSEYIDDAKGIDMVGRRLLYQLGMISWNAALTGSKSFDIYASLSQKLSKEERNLLLSEVDGLMERKKRQFPQIRTTIKEILFVPRNGIPQVKAKPGPVIPAPPEPEKREWTADEIRALRKRLGLTQVKFGELLNVNAWQVSAWETGRSVPADSHKPLLDGLISNK